MSSLARSLRTTAAVAGAAAIGIGMAGTAFAAPSLPALPDADALGALPALPGADVLSGVPLAPGELPRLVNVVGPTVNTSSPALPTLDAFQLPTAPDLALPGVPALPLAGPSLPELGAPALPAAPELGAPELPGLPAVPELPAAPGVDALAPVANLGGFGQVQAPGLDPAELAGQNRVGNAPTAAQALSLAQQIAAEHSVTQQQLGS